jgi:hypothetical protein
MSNRTGSRLIEPAANLVMRMTRLSSHTKPLQQGVNGGAGRDRTDDILLAKQALSQLSYGP